MNRGFLAVAAALVVISAAVLAEADDRPTLSVVAFSAGGSALSTQDSAELADDLAARLEETGRFRVLPREWLPVSTDSGNGMSVAALREAARQAGVGYLVSAVVTGLPSRASVASTSLVGTAHAILSLRNSRRPPVPCYVARPVQTFASVHVRVIDVASGAVVRTSVARARLSTAAGGPALNRGCGGGRVASVVRLAAESRSDLDSLRHVNGEIASSLVLTDRTSRAATR